MTWRAQSRRSEDFGRRVRAARTTRDWLPATLCAAVGLYGDPQQGLSPRMLDRIERGEQRNLEPALVRRLIEVLDLKPLEAWRAAYPEVAEAVLTAVAQPGRELPRRGSACIPVLPAQPLTNRQAA